MQWKIAQGIEKPGYWKTLEGLTIEDLSHSLNLGEYLKRYSVRFSEEETGIYHLNPAERKIIEMGSLLTPSAILELLHEIGHLVYRDNLASTNPQKLKDLIRASKYLLRDDLSDFYVVI